MVVTAPKPTQDTSQLQPIPLTILLSRKSQEALRGIWGTKTKSELREEYRKVQQDRTNGEAFYSLVTDSLGCELFCADRRIPYGMNAQELIERGALELGISDEFRQQLLNDVKPDDCIPALMYVRDEAAVWARIKEHAPEIYEAICPSSTKAINLREEEKAQKAAEKRKSQPIANTNSKLTPATNNTETQVLADFRDNLTVSQLNHWMRSVMILEPLNVDKLNRIQDFISKFQRKGYVIDDAALWDVRGLTDGMVKALGRMRELFESDLKQYAGNLLMATHQILNGNQEVEEILLGVPLTFKVEDNQVSVLHAGNVLLSIRGNTVVKDALPVTIAAVVLSRC